MLNDKEGEGACIKIINNFNGTGSIGHEAK